ncbi:MAG TPA: GNAT family N-acetyltransferase [Chthonomonadaceae bacterium]|nr:GNAT family N-acetyltransferase [Chthonomonadaceae bacterium]
MPVPAPYHLRAYLPNDLPRLQEITIATFEPVSIDRSIERILGLFGPIDWKDRKAATISVDCQIQPDGVFVAENAAGEVIGFVTTRLNVASKAGWIPNLAVDPAYQGQGLGVALLEHAIEFLRISGMEIVKIETLEQNPVGQKLYPRLGFVEVARQIHYAKRLTDPAPTTPLHDIPSFHGAAESTPSSHSVGEELPDGA